MIRIFFHRGFLVLSLLFIAQRVCAQDAKTLLTEMASVYAKADRLAYSSIYELFKVGKEEEELVQRSESYFYRNGALSYLKDGTGETVYGSDFVLQTDFEEKRLLIGAATTSPEAFADAGQLLQQCSSVQVKKDGAHFLVVLLFGALSPSLLQSAELRIGASDNLLYQMDLFYAGMQDFAVGGEEPDMAYAHLRITFHNIDLTAPDRPELTQLSTYVQGEKEITPQPHYAGYTLEDNRTK